MQTLATRLAESATDPRTGSKPRPDANSQAADPRNSADATLGLPKNPESAFTASVISFST